MARKKTSSGSTSRSKKTKDPPGSNGQEAETWDQHEASLTETEKRVAIIEQRMLENDWLPGVSDRELAKKWKITPASVRRLAAEANRKIRQTIRNDPDTFRETRENLLQTFRVIQQKAFADGEPQALRVALDATKAIGQYLGLEPPRKLQVQQDEFADWTDEELQAYVENDEPPNRSALGRLNGGNGSTRH